MKTPQLIKYTIMSVFLMLGSFRQSMYTDYATDEPFGPPPGQTPPTAGISTTFILQGNIEKGTIELNRAGIFAKSNHGFVIEKIVNFVYSHKKGDIYIGEISKSFF